MLPNALRIAGWFVLVGKGGKCPHYHFDFGTVGR